MGESLVRKLAIVGRSLELPSPSSTKLVGFGIKLVLKTVRKKMSKGSKFIMGSNKNVPDGQSAGLAPRATPMRGKESSPKETSAFLAPRGEPEKGSVTYRDSRYK